jgi:cell division protein FtsQ
VTTSASTAAGRRRRAARTTRRRPVSRAPSRPARRKPPAKRAKRARFAIWRRTRSRARGSLRRRALLLVGVAGALAVAYFAWFRDSSLVAVEHVKVEEVSSSDRGQIVAALTHAARGMTTLHVQTDRLTSAVQGMPTVESVSADPSFPHGLTIHVAERQPVLVASDGSRRVPVAADGSVLPGVDVGGDLPMLRVDTLPASGRLEGEALGEARTMGAAPAPLRPLIEGATVSSDYGVVLTMRGGIQLRFGTGGGREAKWASIAAVLSDPELTTLTYVDARVPQRPAVGGTASPSPATAPITAGSTPAVTSP